MIFDLVSVDNKEKSFDCETIVYQKQNWKVKKQRNFSLPSKSFVASNDWLQFDEQWIFSMTKSKLASYLTSAYALCFLIPWKPNCWQLKSSHKLFVRRSVTKWFVIIFLKMFPSWQQRLERCWVVSDLSHIPYLLFYIIWMCKLQCLNRI